MEQEPSEGQVKELQAFMETENQKAVIQAAISKLTDICFEKCITKPGNKLDSSEANCVANCAGRFLDSSVFVVNRMMAAAHGIWLPSAARALARPSAMGCNHEIQSSPHAAHTQPRAATCTHERAACSLSIRRLPLPWQLPSVYTLTTPHRQRPSRAAATSAPR